MLPFLSASSLLCICLTVLAVFFPSHWVSVYQGFPRAAHRVTFLACAPCLSSPFAPQICAWVRSVLGMAVLPCAWGHGVRPCLKPAWLLRSGLALSAPHLLKPEDTGGGSSWGEQPRALCKPCPAPREPTDLAGESAGPETAKPAVRRDATSLSNNRVCVMGMRGGCGRRKAVCSTGETQNAP